MSGTPNWLLGVDVPLLLAGAVIEPFGVAVPERIEGVAVCADGVAVPDRIDGVIVPSLLLGVVSPDR